MGARPTVERPGNGIEAASTSTASHSRRDSRRQASMVTRACARRHVPTISPATSRAPGQTRGVQISRRRSAWETSSSRSDPWSRKYVSPLGRRRAGAAGPASVRNAGSSAARMDPRVADRGADGHQSRAERLERVAPSEPDAGPVGEGVRGGRSEGVQVAPRQLETSVVCVDVGCRHGSDRGLTRAVPSDQDGARRRGVPQHVRVHASPRPASPSGISLPSRNACRRAARSSAPRRRSGFSGSRPNVNGATSRAATTVRRSPHGPRAPVRPCRHSRGSGAVSPGRMRLSTGCR